MCKKYLCNAFEERKTGCVEKINLKLNILQSTIAYLNTTILKQLTGQ